MEKRNIVEWLPVSTDTNDAGALYVTKSDDTKVAVRTYLFQQTQQYLNDLPKALPCLVMEDGSVQQSVAELLRECYDRKRKATFVVESRRGNKYVLADFFGFTHPYTAQNSDKFKVGQELKATIEGLEERKNNQAWLELSNVKDPTIVIYSGICASAPRNSYPSVPQPREPRPEPEPYSVWSNLPSNLQRDCQQSYADEPTLRVAEGRKTELKASFVYTQGGGRNIDEQMIEVVQAIAAFMNADGGKLYIGVRNNGNIRGIDKDLPYLNSSKSDHLYYHEDFDGLKQKIFSSVKWHLGDNALEYLHTINFRASKDNPDLHYAIVTIRSAIYSDIIWFDPLPGRNGQDKKLYVRRDAKVQTYPPGDAMVKFIQHRLSKSYYR